MFKDYLESLAEFLRAAALFLLFALSLVLSVALIVALVLVSIFGSPWFLFTIPLLLLILHGLFRLAAFAVYHSY